MGWNLMCAGAALLSAALAGALLGRDVTQAELILGALASVGLGLAWAGYRSVRIRPAGDVLGSWRRALDRELAEHGPFLGLEDVPLLSSCEATPAIHTVFRVPAHPNADVQGDAYVIRGPLCEHGGFLARDLDDATECAGILNCNAVPVYDRDEPRTNTFPVFRLPTENRLTDALEEDLFIMAGPGEHNDFASSDWGVVEKHAREMRALFTNPKPDLPVYDPSQPPPANRHVVFLLPEDGVNGPVFVVRGPRTSRLGDRLTNHGSAKLRARRLDSEA